MKSTKRSVHNCQFLGMYAENMYAEMAIPSASKPIFDPPTHMEPILPMKCLWAFGRLEIMARLMT